MTFEIPTTVDIPDGDHVASLAGVTEDTGQFGKYRKWEWLVEATIEGKAEIVPLTQLTSANTGPQSKSYQQLTAILGEPPKAGSKVESPNGKRVILTIAHNDKGFPTVAMVSRYIEPQQTLPGIPR